MTGASGPDDDDQDEAHKPGRPTAGYRRAIVKNFRPDTGPKGSLSALTAAVPQRAGRGEAEPSGGESVLNLFPACAFLRAVVAFVLEKPFRRLHDFVFAPP